MRVCGGQLEVLGFFFGGLLPELLQGDILRLRYLNNIEIDRGDVSTASDLGEGLLNLIFEQRDASG